MRLPDLPPMPACEDGDSVEHTLRAVARSVRALCESERVRRELDDSGDLSRQVANHALELDRINAELARLNQPAAVAAPAVEAGAGVASVLGWEAER